MKVYFIFFLLLSYISAFSQDNVDACFTINKEKVCVGEEVTVTNCIVPKGNTNGIGILDFGDPNAPGNITLQLNATSNHIYNVPGDYSIKLLGGSKNGELDDTVIVLSVVDPVPIDFNIYTCIDGRVLFELQENSEEEYVLQPFENATEISLDFGSAIEYIYDDTIPKTATIRPLCGKGISHQVLPIGQLFQPDFFNLEGSENGGFPVANVRLNGLAHLKYQIIIDTVAGVLTDLVRNISGDTTLIYPLPNSEACVQIIAMDDCGNHDTSETICVNSLTVQNNNNVSELFWNPLPYPDNEFNEYEVVRNGVPISRVSSSTITYRDSLVRCGVQYSYSIRGIKNQVSASGIPLTGSSVPASIVSLSDKKPQPVTEIVASIFENKSIRLEWEVPGSSPVKSYHIKRSVNGNTPEDYSTIFTNNFFDENVDIPTNDYKYLIYYKDSCENSSDDSFVVSPIILKGSKDIDDRINLNFTRLATDIGSNHLYTLETLDENGNVTESISLAADTFYYETSNPGIKGILKYRIKAAVNGDPSQVSFSNIFSFSNELTFFSPNVFTPNGDGTNDVFKVFGKYLENFNITIFNRWGEVVYFSENMDEGWDGTYKNQPSNPDNYVFVSKATKYTGEEITHKGSFLLIR